MPWIVEGRGLRRAKLAQFDSPLRDGALASTIPCGCVRKGVPK